MIRKFIACAVVALAPSFAFAAGTGKTASVPADSATHAVSGDAKSDTAVKSDAVAKPGKTAHHRAAHKAKSDDAKAGATTGSKTETKS
jgi:hypothetical protein